MPMLALLYLLINSTLSVVNIPYVPYTYSVYLGGCANVTAYMDPLSGYGISSVYVINQMGDLRRAVVEPYSTPTYVAGDVCGTFLAITVDKWRTVGPLIGITYGEPSVSNLLGTAQLNITGGALIEVKSLYKPNVTGGFVFKIGERNALGVYVEDYLAYGSSVTITGYGLVNVTPIDLSSRAPDYYVYVPEPGTNVTGGYPVQISGLVFAPGQRYLLGRPQLLVSQVSVPVIGDCPGVAYISNPLARPVSVLVQLDDGETYIVQMPEFPKYINTTALLGINATDLLGNPLSDYNLTTYVVATGNQIVGRCLVSGLSYYIAVVVNNDTLYYPAALDRGFLIAHTDIIKPKIQVVGWGVGAAYPPISRLGQNITVAVTLNGTTIAIYHKRASPLIVINDTSLAVRVYVTDILGSPLDSFEVMVGNLTFRGRDGVVYVIPLSNTIAVSYHGLTYLEELAPKISLPVMTSESFLKIFAGSLIAGLSAGLALTRKKKEIGGDDTVEV